MLFTKKAAPLPILSLQAAQCVGFEQVFSLLRRISVNSTKEERESLKCGEHLRLVDFYGVQLTEIVTFDHLDADKAKGLFRLWTLRLLVEVEVSLERERTLITNLSDDGFKKNITLNRWKPVQASVWTYESREGGEYFTFPEKSLIRIRDEALRSQEDLQLEQVPYYD